MQIKQYFRGSNHYYEKRNYKLRISIKPTKIKSLQIVLCDILEILTACPTLRL